MVTLKDFGFEYDMSRRYRFPLTPWLFRGTRLEWDNWESSLLLVGIARLNELHRTDNVLNIPMDRRACEYLEWVIDRKEV